jgi:hypothetical protein
MTLALVFFFIIIFTMTGGMNMTRMGKNRNQKKLSSMIKSTRDVIRMITYISIINAVGRSVMVQLTRGEEEEEEEEVQMMIEANY